MKILHLISSGGFYGAESVVAALAREQARQFGHEVKVGVFENAHAPQNNVAGEFEARGVRVIRIPCRRRVDLAAVSSLREIIRRHSIDLVHSHGYKADIYGYLAARRLRVPLVATSHHWTRETYGIRVYEFLDGLFLRSFDGVVAVSERIAAELGHAGVSPDKIRVIDNGIDLTPFNSAPVPVLASQFNKGGRLLIGTAGRLVQQKGMQYFLRAAQQLLKEFPELMFVIAGDGPERGALQELAKELQVANSVYFLGARSDMANVYASLDVFVLASIAEGMPMAALEALASGLAVVATDVGAVSKIIVSGQSGMLVRPADVGELAEAIGHLIRDPALRERLARNGQREAHEKFSSQVMSKNYCKLYEQLLVKKAGPVTTVSLESLRKKSV